MGLTHRHHILARRQHRLLILDQLRVRPTAFKNLYDSLRQPASAAPGPVVVDVSSAA